MIDFSQITLIIGVHDRTEGAIRMLGTGFLISNDGKLAHKLLSPTKHVDKVYELTFDGVFKNAYYKYFLEGIVLDDGYKCMPATFELLEPNKGRITIKEGKYHQVKRMMQALGMEVTSLNRIEFGPLSLPEDLNLGDYRELTIEEFWQNIQKTIVI